MAKNPKSFSMKVAVPIVMAKTNSNAPVKDIENKIFILIIIYEFKLLLLSAKVAYKP